MFIKNKNKLNILLLKLGFIIKPSESFLIIFDFFSPKNAIIAALSLQYEMSGKIVSISLIEFFNLFLKHLFAATPPAITHVFVFVIYFATTY